MTNDKNIARNVLKYPNRFFIDGKWTAPSSDMSFDVIAPATEEVFLTVAAATERDVGAAVATEAVATDEP